jgi:hypothetical protein
MIGLRFETSSLSRYALTSCVAVAMLAGCGGSQPSIGALGTMPQSRAIGQHGDRGKSWMLPEAKSEDLLYVSEEVGGVVRTYRYWPRKRVGVLTGFMSPRGECVDGAGDVYIVDFEANDVLEYSHGGKSPIRVINVAPYWPYGCAVDTKSGNLAVANWWQGDGTGEGSLAIYHHAKGTPVIFQSPLGHYESCAYDDKGDLLTTDGGESSSGYGSGFAYLAKGSTQLVTINISGGSSWDGNFNGVQGITWDGKYWVLNTESYSNEIYRVAIRGLRGHRVGTTYLSGVEFNLGPVFIYNNRPGSQGTQVVGATTYDYAEITYWKYPTGGSPIAQIFKDLDRPYGVAVSLKQIVNEHRDETPKP